MKRPQRDANCCLTKNKHAKKLPTDAKLRDDSTDIKWSQRLAKQPQSCTKVPQKYPKDHIFYVAAHRSYSMSCFFFFFTKIMTNIWTAFLFNSLSVWEHYKSYDPKWDYLHSLWQWQMSTSVLSLFLFSSFCLIRTCALCEFANVLRSDNGVVKIAHQRKNTAIC